MESSLVPLQDILPMRRMILAAIIMIVAGQLVACAGRPGPAVLDPVSVNGLANHELTVLTATNRARDGDGYSSRRNAKPAFERFTIAIPPSHRPSKIEWPAGKPEASTDMVVTERRSLDERQFLALADTPNTDGSVGIFVHGFNYTFQEGLYRLAQVATDAKTDGTPVLFSWPSQGALSGYLADRDAALASRDSLVWLVKSMAAKGDVKRVILFGHSVGGFLIMETLRQLKLEGRGDILNKMVVVLAAPDIDDDLFKSQLEVVGRMRTPITLFVSKDDKALAVASFLSGERPRAGSLNVDSPSVRDAALRYGLRIIDISSIKAADGLGHDRYANLAQLGPQLAQANGRSVSAPEAGSFVFDVAASVISSPFRLAGAVVGGN
jgi:esterase/lipase superfamily enzyme